MPTFTAEQLKKIAVDNFERLDIPTEEAEIVADHLVEASLSGVDSHGVCEFLNMLNTFDREELFPVPR